MNPKMKDILEWCYCVIIAVVLALLFRYYIGTPTIVQQISMKPTLIENQRLWLNRWTRTTKTMPKRGQIITFEAPTIKSYTNTEIDQSNPIARYEDEPTSIFGKFVRYVLEDGHVFINGEQLEEDYLQSGVVTDVVGAGFTDFIVPDNSVFAMGDNRTHSTDCRAFGCIPLEKIESTVAIRIWPLNKWGKVK